MTRIATPRPRLALYVLLAALAIYHAFLLQKGAFAWPDEFYYIDALRTVQALARGDLAEAAHALTGFSARPAANLLWLLPASVHLAFASALHTAPLNRDLVHIANGWNVIVAILVVLALHRLALWFYDGDEWLAAAAAGAYALMPTSHIWVRHVVPYDIALAICTANLYRTVSRPNPPDPPAALRRIVVAATVVVVPAVVYPVAFHFVRSSALPSSVVLFAAALGATVYAARPVVASAAARSAMLWGAIAGATVAMYPAFYSFPIALIALMALQPDESRLIALRRPLLMMCALFAMTLLDVFFFFEVIARIGGVSYLASALRVSGMIKQGTFSEGYVFLPRFLTAVDGVGGVAILSLALLYLITTIVRLVRKAQFSSREIALARTFVVFALLYVVYATESVVLHKMTFTGRYVAMYIPITVIGAFASFRHVAGRTRTYAVAAAVMLSAMSFLAFARAYDAVDYPVDVLAKMRISFNDVAAENHIDESAVMYRYNHPSKAMMPGTRFQTHPNDRRFVLVNFGWFPVEGPGFSPYQPPSGAELLFAATHFECFRTSYFEGYTVERRAQFEAAGPCQLKIYRVPTD